MGDKKRVDGEVVATSVDGDAEVVTKVVSGPKNWVEAVETQGAQGQSAAEICVGMQEKADERSDPFKATELNELEHEKMSPIHAFLFAEDRARAAGGLLYRRWQLGKIMETQRAKYFFIFLVLVNAVLIGIRVRRLSYACTVLQGIESRLSYACTVLQGIESCSAVGLWW